jgi:hypothetical protein
LTTTSRCSTDARGREAAVAIRRYVNDEIAATAIRFAANDTSEFEFVCECGDLACTAFVTMTLAEYQQSEPGSVGAH